MNDYDRDTGEPIVTERHDRQFSGTWCPAEIHEAVAAEKINGNEAFLLMVIDSFVANGRQPCYASNTYLGERIGRSASTVSHMVTKLRDLGFLSGNDWDNEKRKMHPVWRTWSGSYLSENDEAPYPKSDRHPIRNRIQKGNKKKVTSPHPAVGSSAGGVSSSDWGMWKGMATQLAAAIEKVRKVNCTSSITEWAKSFQLLHTVNSVPVDRIKAALDWLCTAYPKFSGHQYFPVVYSGVAFRDKFDKVERAMTSRHFVSVRPAVPTRKERFCGTTEEDGRVYEEWEVIDNEEITRELRPLGEQGRALLREVREEQAQKARK